MMSRREIGPQGATPYRQSRKCGTIHSMTPAKVVFDHRHVTQADRERAASMSFNDFISDTLSIEDETSLFLVFRRFLSTFSADVVSYHIVVEHLKRLKLEHGLVYHCFPEPWVERYRDQNYFEHDPIIAHALTVDEPFHWFDIGKLVRLNLEQRAFLDDLRAHGLVDGLGVPVFGARGTVAYFGVGSTQHTMRLPPHEIVQIQYACHLVHRRYVDIHGEIEAGPTKLSMRETEVLQWLAQGKSNSVIADILGISEHTVDTLVRRCFQKLGVTDRVSAAVRGVGTGLVWF